MCIAELYKKKKGFAHYYWLINASRKIYDRWNTPCNSLENNILLKGFYENVKQILRLNRFNNLKNFQLDYTVTIYFLIIVHTIGTKITTKTVGHATSTISHVCTNMAPACAQQLSLTF